MSLPGRRSVDAPARQEPQAMPRRPGQHARATRRAGQEMGEPSQPADRDPRHPTGASAGAATAQPLFLWCAPRLICIVPSATALLSRPGETRVQRVAMPLQSTEGPTTKRPLPGSGAGPARSEEHTSELQSLMPLSYADFFLKKIKK